MPSNIGLCTSKTRHSLSQHSHSESLPEISFHLQDKHRLFRAELKRGQCPAEILSIPLASYQGWAQIIKSPECALYPSSLLKVQDLVVGEGPLAATKSWQCRNTCREDGGKLKPCHVGFHHNTLCSFRCSHPPFTYCFYVFFQCSLLL